MKISIITPTYNSQSTIERTILSVLNQTCLYEYIVVDGGSRDSTIHIVMSYLGKANINLVTGVDRGVYDAMNKGISLSNGDIVGIINSDDWYEPKILESIKMIFENDSSIDIIHGNMNIWKNEEFIRVQMPRKLTVSNIQKGMPINHPTCFIKKACYNKYGLYDLNYKISADYEYFCRLHQNQVKMYYLPRCITNMSLGGLSDKQKKISAFEGFHIKKKYGYSSAMVYYHLTRGLLRAYLR